MLIPAKHLKIGMTIGNGLIIKLEYYDSLKNGKPRIRVYTDKSVFTYGENILVMTHKEPEKEKKPIPTIREQLEKDGFGTRFYIKPTYTKTQLRAIRDVKLKAYFHNIRPYMRGGDICECGTIYPWKSVCNICGYHCKRYSFDKIKLSTD